MHDMGAEVNTQPNTDSKMEVVKKVLNLKELPDNKNVHAGDLNGEPPPMHESRNINAGEKNAHHHEY
jgi:hypothetical protein